MKNQKENLKAALQKVQELDRLIQGMEYEDYLVSKLILIQIELKRQLSFYE